MDGGLLKPVPVDILLQRGADKVIAIDLLSTNYEINDFRVYPLMAECYALLLQNQVKQYDPDRVFMVNPKFQTPFNQIYKFNHWKDYYKDGERAIAECWPRLQQWLTHTSSSNE